MLPFCLRAQPRARAASLLALSPNSRTNAALGSCSIGSGEVGPAQAMVPV